MLTPHTPVPDPGAPEDEPPSITRERPVFSGRAGEYFGIWIVNVLLSIVTLGIYSAWATVRTQRYFYGNTRLAGSAFEYLADPIRILKGRLVAYAIVIVLVLSSHFLPVLYLALILLLTLLMPLLVFLAARFRARYSAWRGVRFRFTGGAGEAYGPFFGWVLLTGLTFSLLYPIAKTRQHAYLVDGHRFGTTAFRYSGDAGSYYIPYLIAMGIGVAMMVAMFLVTIGAIAASSAVSTGSDGPGDASAWIVIAVFPLFYLGLFALMAFLRVRYVNLMWRSSALGSHRFESTLRARDVIWLYASNLVAIVCTLGLATPWAMIRLARYRATHFAVLVSGDLDSFLADVEAERASAGAELVDAMDYGVDIGI
ncbi:DUF898 domain-containing protein [Luteimonas aestuarii]|uniref:DUF898 domain-containing protein n=1 Tax=Luteimonas aestuarii TaxID=453837 RepID=A0A4V3AMZ2_9GAMM|nr:YjgN family protein [Luteimonas aestuarii]TDK28615.1 DUF898 domain-containing protein [Luteimonas aestuarii]